MEDTIKVYIQKYKIEPRRIVIPEARDRAEAKFIFSSTCDCITVLSEHMFKNISKM
jgi:hypothetical protein